MVKTTINTSSYPIAMIPYINMAPFRQMSPPKRCRFVSLVPKDSVAALQKGHVMAAAVPVGGLPLLENIVEPLGKFGIAAKRESMSVMLFSDRPFNKMDRTCTIHLTGDSTSSVRLLYLLWVNILGIDNLPRSSKKNDSINGELLIGDQALKRAIRVNRWGKNDSDSNRKENDPLFIVTDLASIWWKNYNLPFVFARWVVRKDAPFKVKEILSDWLEQFREQESKMVEACIEPTAHILKVDTTIAKRYFQVIQRCLDDTHLLGQQRFLAEYQKVKRKSLFNF
jgi:chorismate dehydratase